MSVNVSVEEFYSGVGQVLIDPGVYPVEIVEHLTAEKLALKRLIENGGYDTVVEVGCMDGTMHLDVCTDSLVNYVGIDLIEEGTIVLQDKLTASGYPKHSIVKALDVLNIADIADDIKVFAKKVLVFFPFNSFGNLEFPGKAVAAISSCDFDIAVLTYLNDQHTNDVRFQYYSNCEYQELSCSSDEKGIQFSATQGLNSYAYSGDWIEQLAQVHNSALSFEKMGKIGCCYLFKRT
jgi:hypothetical protein